MITIPRSKWGKYRTSLYKTDADILHSQCARLDTYLSFKHNPQAKKVISISDIRSKKIIKTIGKYEHKPFAKRQWSKIVDLLFRKALQNADKVTTQAHTLIPEIRSTYHYKGGIQFLPNFIDLPTYEIKKSSSPSVLWLGRLDPIKRPELTLNLAIKTPKVDFNIIGQSNNPLHEKQLVRSYSHFPNIHFYGHVSEEERNRLLSESWILINTSIHEGLPSSFLEAMANKCALLSTCNPDSLTEKFGSYQPNYSTNLHFCLISGLNYLLKNNKWQELGEEAFEYVRQVHSTETIIQRHINMYEELLN